MILIWDLREFFCARFQRVELGIRLGLLRKTFLRLALRAQSRTGLAAVLCREPGRVGLFTGALYFSPARIGLGLLGFVYGPLRDSGFASLTLSRVVPYPRVHVAQGILVPEELRTRLLSPVRLLAVVRDVLVVQHLRALGRQRQEFLDVDSLRRRQLLRGLAQQGGDTRARGFQSLFDLCQPFSALLALLVEGLVFAPGLLAILDLVGRDVRGLGRCLGKVVQLFRGGGGSDPVFAQFRLCGQRVRQP